MTTETLERDVSLDEDETTYTYAELSQRAKDSALQTYGQPHYDWQKDTIDGYKEDQELIGKGFNISRVYCSGFGSQGDGASWIGYIQLPEYIIAHMTNPEDAVLREILLALLYEGNIGARLQIGVSGRYYHEYSMHTGHPHVEYFGSDNLDDVVTATGNMFNGALLHTVCEAFEALGNPEGLLDTLCDEALEAARDIARRIYKYLEAEHDHLCSEESFIDSCNANDWRFDEDGKLV